MKKFQDRFRMASSRAAWWDYSTDGIYFITICTAGDVHYFGQIVNAVMGLSELGWVAHNCWMEIPTHFPFVKLDVFVVMPNHIHVVLHQGFDVVGGKPNLVVEVPRLLEFWEGLHHNLQRLVRLLVSEQDIDHAH